MKKILLICVALILIGVIFVSYKVLHTNVYGKTTEISLRIFGVNLISKKDWSGHHSGPVTWDMHYTDLTKISTALFDSALMKKVGTTQDDFMTYGLTHKNNLVYVILTKKDGSKWYTPELVTDNKDKTNGRIYIKGRIDGGSAPTSYEDKTLALNLVYDGIQNSQEVRPLTDLFGVNLVSQYQNANTNDWAKIAVDKNGNSSLKEILVNDKLCMSRGYINFNDTDCWKDFRQKRSGDKKYSDFYGFLGLLIRKVLS